jgi:hypothetical protein
MIKIRHLTWLLLASCGVPNRSARPESPNPACDSIRIQDHEWNASNLKASVSCLVEDPQLRADLQKLETSRFERLASALEAAFRDPSQRALFLETLSLLEGWRRQDLAAFLGEPGLGAVITDPSLPEALPLLNLLVQRLLPLLESDPALLQRELLLFKRVMGGDRALARQTLQQVRRALPAFRGTSDTEHARLFKAARELIKRLQADLSLQSALGRLADAPLCRSARNTPTQTRPQIMSALEFFKSDRRRPRAFANSLAQGYLVWEAVCQPDDGLRPQDAARLLRFSLDDFAFLSELAPQLPSSAALVPALNALRNSGEGGSSERNLIQAVDSSRIASTLLAMLSERSDFDLALSRLPNEEMLLSFMSAVERGGLSPKLFAHAGDWRRMARLLQVFERQPLLLAGLTEVLGALESEHALQRLSRAAQDGSLTEGLRLLSRIGPQGGLPSITPLPHLAALPSEPPAYTVPALSESVENERRRALMLVERCLPRKIDEATWDCLTSQGLATGPENKAAFRQLQADDPLFALARKMPLGPWLAADSEAFWRAWLQVARRLKLPVESALRWFATGENLPRRSREHMMRALHEALDDERANSPGAQARDPIGASFYLDRMSERLFASGDLVPVSQRPALARVIAKLVGRRPETRLVRSLRSLARKRLDIFLTHAQRQEGANYRMNGIEAYDRLLWELQVPIARDPDKIMKIVNSWVALRSPDEVNRWMDEQRRDIATKLALAEIVTSNDSPMIHGLRNAKRLLQLIHERHSSEEIWHFGQLLAAFAEGSQYERSEMEALLRLHQMGLVGALAHLFEHPPQNIGNTLEGDARPLAEIVGRISTRQAWEMARLNHYGKGRLLRAVAVLGVASLSDTRNAAGRVHWDWLRTGFDSVLAPWLAQLPSVNADTLNRLNFPAPPASLGALVGPELPQAAGLVLRLHEDFGGRRGQLLEAAGVERFLDWIGSGVPRRLLTWTELLEARTSP